MKEINLHQLECVIEQMKHCQKEHPKARIMFNLEYQRVDITYPLPKDYFELKDIKVYRDKKIEK